jgi:DNA adenine methylase
LFYLNPSYWGSEADYGSGVFPRSEFERVAEILAGIEGRLILSINDVPELREIFSAFPYSIAYNNPSDTDPGARDPSGVGIGYTAAHEERLHPS